ncbi:immunoglobulin superfamily member 3-like [Astyanax mexicanus]|uniref:Immunoglobulin superfamily member 3-like n=1 Tax=Astyanax mexicanus TaxID=7994 RepID=A0A8B9LPW7_ASTMX|nr:immunoglobulin superfamily member 3-like [Astyanax mexicanus]
MALWLKLWLFPLLMCLAGLLLSDICKGEHLVHIQEGPLFRVKGYPISISCNVSGYIGSNDQCFSFSIFKPDKPDIEIGIISTCEKDYAYAVYSKRVRERSITIERRSKTSVIFHILSLEAEDAGTYECYTPNSYATYDGTYSAQITMKVIEDTLKVSYAGPRSHSISEGDALQLESEVSSQTLQHTHLSVTWYLSGSTETFPIITLDRDLTVRPGAAFEDQYRSGLISIEKVEDTTYKLKMSQVEKSASGEIYCQAEEWIQDPDRSWTRIAHRNTTGTTVEIKTLDVAEKGSFLTDISVGSGSLQEGDKVVIRCSVQADNLPGRFFSISWLKNNVEVANIGPSGVLTVTNDYKARENDGELRAVKISEKSYDLTIQPVKTVDQGQYKCRATEEERTETGAFNRGQSQQSREQTVSITAKESGLAVVMANRQVQVTEGQTLKLTCSVSGASGPLSVSWQHKKTSSSSLRDVVRLTREGVMADTGSQYQQRIVRAFRLTAADFTLEISDAVVSDSGEYTCTVFEWNRDSSGSMKEVKRQSQQGTVSVSSIDSLLSVSLRSRTSNVFENSLISLHCKVKGPNVPFDVHWKFQKAGSTDQKDIVCMLRTGEISCGAEQKDYQLEAKVQESGTDFILKVLRPSKRHSGLYHCQITAYLGKVQKAQKLSNGLAAQVNSPAGKLSLKRPESRLEFQVKSNARVDCLIIEEFSNASRFAVTWMFNSQNLVRMEPEGVITLGSSDNQEMDQRINMQMVSRQNFQLVIQQVRSTDSGTYNCSVEEWIQDPDGVWYPLSRDSASLELVVNDKAKDFSLDTSDHQMTITEGKQVDLNCSMTHDALDPTLQYSLTWFFESQDQKSTVQLLKYNYDGRLQFPGPNRELQRRLHFSRPTTSAFHLSILNSIVSDSGRYYCQIDQYQLDCEGKWDLKASAKSGFTNVRVNYIENKLQVKKASRSLNITDLHSGFTLECEISSRTSDRSHFEVTWTRSQQKKEPEVFFTVKKDGTFSKENSIRYLIYDRPHTTLYRLTVPDVDPFDDGQYQCEVVEWLQTNEWRKMGEDKSGIVSVHVESEEKQSADTLALENPNTHLNPIEGQQFDLYCTIHVNKVDPTMGYTLTWMVAKSNSNKWDVFLTHSYDGHLQYHFTDQQLKSRLQISKSPEKTFHLTVFNSSPDDSGRYQCRVEQFQLLEGKWERKGTAESNSTMVTVNNIESKLQVKKVQESLNITDLHAGFTVKCEIQFFSSNKSVFEVTWSRIEENKPPLISVSRDGIVHSTIPERGLVYQRPSATLFTLTVPDVNPSDSGQYQCQVVEWLQTSTNNWRKIAEDESGELSVHVYDQGDSDKSKQDCSSGAILGSLIPLIICLLVIIVLLSIVIQKAKSASKKQKDCLWAENNPLKPVAEPGEGDNA